MALIRKQISCAQTWWNMSSKNGFHSFHHLLLLFLFLARHSRAVFGSLMPLLLLDICDFPKKGKRKKKTERENTFFTFQVPCIRCNWVALCRPLCTFMQTSTQIKSITLYVAVKHMDANDKILKHNLRTNYSLNFYSHWQSLQWLSICSGIILFANDETILQLHNFHWGSHVGKF